MAVNTTTSLFSHETFRRLVLEPLMQQSVVASSLTRIDTDSTTAYLPRVHDGNVGWVAEAAEIPDSGLAADMYPVTPTKLAGLVFTSNESLEDANAAEVLGQALARQLAIKADASFFEAGGAPAPIGLPGVAGIGTVDASPTSSLDPYATAIGNLEAAGAQATVIFMAPDAWTALVTLKETAGSERPVLTSQSVGPTGQTQRSLFGVPVRVSNGVPAATAYVVDGGRCAAVVRRDGDVRSDSSVRFTSDVTAVRATMRIGWAVPYPEAAVVIVDAA